MRRKFGDWVKIMSVETGAPPRSQRTRRNILSAISVASAAALARVTSANAAPPPFCEFKCAVNCFLRGTRIETPDGYRNIEDLAVGDLLLTRFGGAQPIQWIARRKFEKADPSKPWVKDVRPVKLAKSALGDNAPSADLFVTSGHALLIDGVLVPAGCLINGETITRHAAAEWRMLEYFHIKLASHDVILAQGVACETLRRVNEDSSDFGDYLRQHGAQEANAPLCAPFVGAIGGRAQTLSHLRSALAPWLDRRQPIDVIRDRLDDRAIALRKQLAPAL